MLNGGAVVVAALYFGQELLVPLVLAGLLAFVLAPLARLLQRAYLPHVVASLLAVVIAFVILGLLSLVVGGQISTLVARRRNTRPTSSTSGSVSSTSNRLVADSRAAEQRHRRERLAAGAGRALRPAAARPGDHGGGRAGSSRW